jgi:DNA-binding LacI/PurR family transcriptional regulator
MKIITIKDIAKACGVSIAVASVSLRNKKGTTSYSKETQRRVIAAAKELGYVPNPFAQNLRNGQNNSIALLFSLVGPHDSAAIPQKISKLFWDNEKKPTFISRTAPIETLQMQLTNQLQQHIPGIALEFSSPLSNEAAKLLKQFIAPVLVTRTKSDIDIDLIFWDRKAAIRKAVDHLIKSGRKKMALLCEPRSNPTKQEAFDKQLQKYNINPDKHHIFPEDGRSLTNADNAYNIINTMYSGKKFPFDSIVCSNDELAIASIYWLKENGYNVPEDVAVIGFDNSQNAKYIFPPLASVERKHDKIGETIYNLLSSRLKCPKLPKRTINVEMEFIWRKSAG